MGGTWMQSLAHTHAGQPMSGLSPHNKKTHQHGAKRCDILDSDSALSMRVSIPAPTSVCCATWDIRDIRSLLNSATVARKRLISSADWAGCLNAGSQVRDSWPSIGRARHRESRHYLLQHRAALQPPHAISPTWRAPVRVRTLACQWAPL